MVIALARQSTNESQESLWALSTNCIPRKETSVMRDNILCRVIKHEFYKYNKLNNNKIKLIKIYI